MEGCGDFNYTQGFVRPYAKPTYSSPKLCTTGNYLNNGEEHIDLAEFLSLDAHSAVRSYRRSYEVPALHTNINLSFGPGQVLPLDSSRVNYKPLETMEDPHQDQLSGAPGKSPRAKPSEVVVGKKLLDKNTDEYKKRRERNNVAVRRSRDKTRNKRDETERKVKELEDENQDLRDKLTLLNKEINVLKSLFTTVGSSATEQ